MKSKRTKRTAGGVGDRVLQVSSRQRNGRPPAGSVSNVAQHQRLNGVRGLQVRGQQYMEMLFVIAWRVWLHDSSSRTATDCRTQDALQCLRRPTRARTTAGQQREQATRGLGQRRRRRRPEVVTRVTCHGKEQRQGARNMRARSVQDEGTAGASWMICWRLNWVG